ncbi:MAG TPA: hypothetical protein VG537_06375, partial [Candidatus Kapabacteria bacterium]|nr:hypothetical protein [Candidatus Kapabacteria bacterium]
MKHLLRIVFFTLLSFICVHSIVNAQTIVQRPAIAFETADRSVLYIKQLNPDSAVQAYDFHTIDPNEIDSVRHLAILGMTQDGKRIIYAAELGYVSPSNSQHLVYYGLFSSVLYPHYRAFINGDIKVLLLAPHTNLSFRPVGALSSDGTQWWVTFTSGSSGNAPVLAFYHGNVDGTGTIESDSVTAEVAGNNSALQGGYHISNITIDATNNNNMIAVSYDGLNDQLDNGRFLLYDWAPGHPIRATNFTGTVKALQQNIQQTDSLFGLTVQAVGDGNNVDIALTNLGNVPDNTLKFFRTRYNATSDLLPTNRYLQRSSIPDTMDFFAGTNIGPYTENISTDAQRGMGGDVSFSTPNSGNDTAVFITHDSPDAGNVPGRNQRSAIFMQDFATGSTTMVYNNPAAQELQPVFVTMPYLIPPIVHDTGIMVKPTTLTFAATDTASMSASQNITITDTSAFAPVTIDSVTLTGPNASQFIVGTTFPQGIDPTKTLSVPITFAPVGLAGPRNAMLTVYFAVSSGGTRQVVLNGTAKVKPGQGVNEDPALSIDVSIMPNPF